LFVLILILAKLGHETPQQQIANIERGCERQFAHLGQHGINQCKIELMLGMAETRHRDALDRARRGY
jgi:hypothetical protein